MQQAYFPCPFCRSLNRVTDTRCYQCEREVCYHSPPKRARSNWGFRLPDFAAQGVGELLGELLSGAFDHLRP